MESCLSQSQGYIGAKLVCARNSSKDSHWVENNSGEVEQCIRKTQMRTPELKNEEELTQDLKEATT